MRLLVALSLGFGSQSHCSRFSIDGYDLKRTHAIDGSGNALCAANLTLAQLFAPLTVDEFKREYLERKPMFIRRKNPGYFRDLLRQRNVFAYIQNGSSIKVRQNGVTPPANQHDVQVMKRVKGADGEWWTGMAAAAKAWVDSQYCRKKLAQGFTVLVNEVEKWSPTVAALASSALADGFSVPNANVYLTPGGTQGFEAHFDFMDVLVLQLEGCKDWTVYEPLFALPTSSQKFKPTSAMLDSVSGSPTDEKKVLQVRLCPGSVLYLPRGYPHEARAANTSMGTGTGTGTSSRRSKKGGRRGKRKGRRTPSLHLTLGLGPWPSHVFSTFEGLVHLLIDRLAEASSANSSNHKKTGGGGGGEKLQRAWAATPARHAAALGGCSWLQVLHAMVRAAASEARTPASVMMRRALPVPNHHGGNTPPTVTATAIAATSTAAAREVEHAVRCAVEQTVRLAKERGLGAAFGWSEHTARSENGKDDEYILRPLQPIDKTTMTSAKMRRSLLRRLSAFQKAAENTNEAAVIASAFELETNADGGAEEGNFGSNATVWAAMLAAEQILHERNKQHLSAIKARLAEQQNDWVGLGTRPWKGH